MLFYDRLQRAFRADSSKGRNLHLYLTGDSRGTNPADLLAPSDSISSLYNRRFSQEDLIKALGNVEERGRVVAYVCGPPGMTDEVVGLLKGAEGMDEQRVLCEKWW